MLHAQRKASVILCLLAIAVLIVSACAPAAAPAPKSAAPGGPAATAKPAAETPKSGGTLISFMTGNPPSLDAQQESTINTSQLVSPFYSNIVQADPLTVDKWVPALAEKWEMSKDGLTWTFDMRQGVKFHDGTPYTVDDAIFSLQRLIEPPKGVVSNMSFLLKPAVKSMTKNGNKLVVNMNFSFAVMLDTLANNYSAIYSQKYVEKQGDMKTTGMGTGPFKLKSYSPGVSLEGVKNPDFWVKGRPYLDGYTFLIIKDESTRLSAFRTGKVNMTGKQFATLTPPDKDMLLKENPALKFYPSPSFLGSWFFMNTRKPPFQDQKVRKAAYLALDRQAAIKVVARGSGEISKPFPVDPWGIPTGELSKMPGYRQPKDQDIADAKKLMADAGFANGFDLTILARQMWQSKDAAVFMTDQLAKIGVRAKVQTLEDAIYWDTGRKAGHEAMVYTPVWTFTDPHWMGRYWAPKYALNFSGNDGDTKLTNLWDEQIKVVDVEKRKAMIRQVEEHLIDALPGISIVWYHQFIGVRPEVRNFYPGIGDYVGNTLEEIWLAK
ncbi:MAG: ABC transporter substrate-binding protein [Chloroflexi bacterium]|nr:ABC transporter substrate-binding protein [Chloroflexota bacterium]